MKNILFLFLTLFSFSANAFMAPEEIKEIMLKKELDKHLTISTEKSTFFIAKKDRVLSVEKQQSLKKWKMNHPQLASFEQMQESVDLRSRDTSIKSQWSGTCTAFGLISSLENLLGGKINLSERHFWSMYGKYSAEIAIKTALKPGSFITGEDYWPQENTRPYSKYKDNAKNKVLVATELGADINKAIEKLIEGKPLYLAIQVTQDMYNCEKVIGSFSDTIDGGHAVSIVGYKLDKSFKSGGYFIIKNSWGSKCGDGGYQYLSFNQCKRDDMYCMLWSIDQAKTK